MIIHFIKSGDILTLCGLSTAGRDVVATSEKKRDVTCSDCKLALLSA